jgi:uncharacterized protein YaaN involved in tellurite resistance
MILLYFFSKLLIIPKYDAIKSEIIQHSLKNSSYVKCKRIKSYVSVFNLFFTFSNLSYINPFRFYNNKFNIDVEDFVITKKEVDKIYVILKQYENDIHKANDNLEKQYKANVHFFEQLEKYIVAGEIGLEEIDAFVAQLQANPNISEQEKQMQVQKLNLTKDMLSQRVYDLQIAENVAMQTCPMIQTMQMSNFNLMRKINSSFIITLPIFKQCLVQAIQLKRQEIQAKSIKQLDEKTNELLLRNAQNTANQSVNIARMAGGSSIQIETLKSTYETIKAGIEETKKITEEQAQKRKNDSMELETMKADMKNKGFVNA